MSNAPEPIMDTMKIDDLILNPEQISLKSLILKFS